MSECQYQGSFCGDTACPTHGAPASEEAGSPAHRERLQPVLAELDAAGHSTFLDLCELVLMLSERVDGMIKFNHPRVLVHIKQKREPRQAPAKVTPP